MKKSRYFFEASLGDILLTPGQECRAAGLADASACPAIFINAVQLLWQTYNNMLGVQGATNSVAIMTAYSEAVEYISGRFQGLPSGLQAGTLKKLHASKRMQRWEP